MNGQSWEEMIETRSRGFPKREPCSTTQPELLDYLPVLIQMASPEIAEQPAAAANHLEKAPPAVLVLGVLPEMLCELVDSSRQERYLDRSRSVVVVLPGKCRDYCLFLFSVHACCLAPLFLSSSFCLPHGTRPPPGSPRFVRALAGPCVWPQACSI